MRRDSTLNITDINSDPPYWVSQPLRGTNDQWTHAMFVLSILQKGVLGDGDYLVEDNAKIHAAKDSVRLVQYFLDLYGVTRVFLPKYWPELNPAELLFGRGKRYMTDERGPRTFVIECLKGLMKTNKRMMRGFYRRALEYPFVR